jgi:hypothetical protein
MPVAPTIISAKKLEIPALIAGFVGMEANQGQPFLNPKVCTFSAFEGVKNGRGKRVFTA